jgi:hypothetical protein
MIIIIAMVCAKPVMNPNDYSINWLQDASLVHTVRQAQSRDQPS